MRRIICAALFMCSGQSPIPAQASGVAAPFHNVSANELVRHPTRHLNTRIQVSGVYCFSDGTAYSCTTTAPLQIVAGSMAPGKLTEIIDGQCGGLDAIERTPICRVNVRFVPLAVSFKSGEYALNNRLVPAKITVINATQLFVIR
jgi:hypothetical protein